MEEIKRQVKDVLEFSQETYGISVDNLIDSWCKNKKKYIEFFGNKLIYEYPEKVSFELNKVEKLKKVDNFAEWARYYCNSEDLFEFILETNDQLFANSLKEDYITNLFDENNKRIVIQKGTKIVKAFKYFIKNKEKLIEVQNKASQIIQEDKISGHICLSVHPLDYLSSSENNYNWRSCHALDGEYCAGNLSYMVDSTTIVCYLKSDEDTILPHFPSSVPWNNKKWRVLLHISNDKSMLFLGRQYPFSSDSAANFITDKLLVDSGLFSSGYTWTPWTSSTVNSVKVDDEQFFLKKEYIPVGDVLKTFNEIIKDGENALNFNDLLRSSVYNPQYCYTCYPKNDEWNFHNFALSFYKTKGNIDTRFVIGEKVKCLRCNKNYITNSATILCDSCEEKYGKLNNDYFGFCACCGRHMRVENGRYVEDDLLCESCYEECADTCAECGVSFYKGDMKYSELLGDYVCRYCYSER